MSDRNGQDTGTTMRQGPAGANGNQRRELPDGAGDRRTGEQRDVHLAPQRTDESGKAKDDPSRAPESGTP